MRVSLLILLAICLTLLPSVVHAQIGPEPLAAEWTVGDAPEGGWTVGDHIPLRLSITYPVQMEVTLPDLPANWGPFEVLEQGALEPVENENGTLTLVREATVVPWSPGGHQTPPLLIRYRDVADNVHEISAPPLTISVVSVLEEGATEKRDLKDQVFLPGPALWPGVLGGLLLAALVGVAGWFLFPRLHRRTISASAPVVILDTRPPEEIAYGELDRIASLDLPTQGELKRHYTLVTDCMRFYVEGRYRVPALDRTTGEMATALRQARVQRKHVILLRDLLADADLVKFAKARPAVDQARGIVTQARHIVDVTKVKGAGDGARITHPSSQTTDQE